MNVCSFINARLEKCPLIQLLCVGPEIDLYRRFAGEKLVRIMEAYPEPEIQTWLRSDPIARWTIWLVANVLLA